MTSDIPHTMAPGTERDGRNLVRGRDVPALAIAGTVTLRRALLVAAGPHATPQDQIDCAELLLTTGYPDGARMLAELAFIRGGFARRHRAAQHRLAVRTGLWPATDDAVPPDDARPRFAIDQAVIDLKRLIAIPLDPARTVLLGRNDAVVIDEPPASDAEPEVQAIDGPAMADLSARLYDALRRADAAALEPLLDTVEGKILTQRAYRLEHHFHAPIADLMAMTAFNGLRRFFLANRQIGWAPFGSAALIAAAAALEDVGLGTYLANVPRLIRSSRDILGLIGLAGLDMGPAHKPMLERWSVLLSAHIEADDRVGLADELGDLGLMRALRGLIENGLRHPGRDRYLYWAIRDAALDNGDGRLAVAAQTAITHITRYDPGEMVVLAEILATADSDGAAEAMLMRVLARSPDDRGAATRLAAIRANRFEAYRAERGFSSSRHRSALRMRHRAERDQARAAAEEEVPAEM